MESNIILKDYGQLEITGSYLEVRAHDLKLDNPHRRSSNDGHRRALVHDFDDGLTINYDGDYPGGVTVKGKLKAEEAHFTSSVLFKGKLKAEEAQFTSSVLFSKRAVFKESPIVPDLLISNLVSLKKSKTIKPTLDLKNKIAKKKLNLPKHQHQHQRKLNLNIDDVIQEVEPEIIHSSLVGIITNLQEEIFNLKARITALEA